MSIEGVCLGWRSNQLLWLFLRFTLTNTRIGRFKIISIPLGMVPFSIRMLIYVSFIKFMSKVLLGLCNVQHICFYYIQQIDLCYCFGIACHRFCFSLSPSLAIASSAGFIVWSRIQIDLSLNFCAAGNIVFPICLSSILQVEFWQIVHTVLSYCLVFDLFWKVCHYFQPFLLKTTSFFFL